MDALDYYFLDLVVEHPYGLDWLGAPQAEYELMFNRTYHGLCDAALAARLAHLVSQGYIQCYDSQAAVPLLPCVSLSIEQIAAALAGSTPLGYALTHNGGALWEQLSQPRWNHYIVSQGVGDDQQRASVTAGDPAQVQRYLDLLPMFTTVDACLPQDIIWTQHRPWRATYWKTLPVGYEASYTALWTTHDPLPYERYRAYAHERDALHRWYTHPFAERD